MQGVTSEEFQELKTKVAVMANEQTHIKANTDKIPDISTAIATLKVKSGIWGLIGGAIPTTIGIVFILIRTFKGG